MKTEVTAKRLRMNKSSMKKYTHENDIPLTRLFDLNAITDLGYVSSLAYLMRKEIKIFLPDAHDNTIEHPS